MGSVHSKLGPGAKPVPPPWPAAAMADLVRLLLLIFEMQAAMKNRRAKPAARREMKVSKNPPASAGSQGGRAAARQDQALSSLSDSLATAPTSQQRGGSGAAKRGRRSRRGRGRRTRRGKRRREKRRRRRQRTRLARPSKKCRLRFKKLSGTETPPAATAVVAACAQTPCRVDSLEECAKIIDATKNMHLGSGILIAVPIPKQHPKQLSIDVRPITLTRKASAWQNDKGKQISDDEQCLKQAAKFSDDMEYQVRLGILEAGAFGVTQTRNREFIWAAAPGETLLNWPETMHIFPRPDLKITLPDSRFYAAAKSTSRFCSVTVKDKIGDLPLVDNGASKPTIQKKIKGDTPLLSDHISKEMNKLNLIKCNHIPKRPGCDCHDLLDEKVKLSSGQLVELIPWCLPYWRLDWESNFPTSVTDPQPMGKVDMCFNSDQERIISVRECAQSQLLTDVELIARTRKAHASQKNKGKQICDDEKVKLSTWQLVELIPWCLPNTATRHNQREGLYGSLDWEGNFPTSVTDRQPMGKVGRCFNRDQDRIITVRECAQSQEEGVHIAAMQNIEQLCRSKKAIKLDIKFPHGLVEVDALEDDNLQSVLCKLEGPICRDAYYTCENKIVCQDKKLSETNVCNGSKLVAHPRLRGGSGGEGSSRPTRLTKTSFAKYMEKQNKKEFFEAVEIPEPLHVKDQDSFVVMLGKDGRKTLCLILECLERRWRRKKCLKGLFKAEDILFYEEYGIMEIECKEYDIDDAGFVSDASAFQRIVLQEHFKYEHKIHGKIFPMYVEGLSKELLSNAREPGYCSDEDKRSLIHNNAATMCFERRIQIYTAVFRYLRTLRGKNKTNFCEAIDPGSTKEHVLKIIGWIGLFESTSTVLWGRYSFNKDRYKRTYLSLMEFSRCVFEHGPTVNVSEKQCEAALYLLNRDLFQHFHRIILTVYKEIPVVPTVPLPQVPQAASTSYVPPGLRSSRLAADYVPTYPTSNHFNVKRIYSNIKLCNASKVFVNPQLHENGGKGSSIPTKVSFENYMAAQQQEFFEVVEIPDSLRVELQDSFLVMLGEDGRTALRLMLECLERRWNRKKCLRGLFRTEDIWYYQEYGIIEIECDEFDIDDAGFTSDASVFEEIVLQTNFKYRHNTKGTVYPMHVEGLSELLCNATQQRGYYSDEDKRSLIYNNAAIMPFEQRIQIYTAVIRYWKMLKGDNKLNFCQAMDPCTSTGRVLKIVGWIGQFATGADIFWARYNFDLKKRYKRTYLSLLDFSRCVFEHGPTDKVTEKQCEAALYLLNNKLFQHVHRIILTVYEEIPNVPHLPQPQMRQPASATTATAAYVPPHLRGEVPEEAATSVAPTRRLAASYVPTVRIVNHFRVKRVYSKI
ncbi:uncharacterized protein [Lolium perenne]|uniref:uncharacterized protein isoform X2 n=1 Tax=Lolium perenne TaxID=4522 RepID=UPI0021F66AB7|nr:uncharacterized protein LOC127291846 isoform X2 [Lolium perenne]